MTRGWTVAVLLALGAAGAAAADLEKELARRWVGAWVVVLPEVASDCSGFYTDTEVRGRLASSKGRHRFEGGELAQVDKLNVASGRVDLYLTLAEGLLVPRREGPFELFDERTCKVQLMVELPRGVAGAGRLEGAMEVLTAAAVALTGRSWPFRWRCCARRATASCPCRRCPARPRQSRPRRSAPRASGRGTTATGWGSGG